ncbi:MAG: glycosyltransferase family 39 protein, partial [Alphaproteobacteria bacterium]|nr:glycosyltransferase family 39 protein [Alphaproteobacteria bacterium]
KRPCRLLTALCLLLWLPGFFTIPPTDRDEARFAQATKQMLERGDFVRIRNGDEERNRKPVGIYWLQAPFAAAARAAGIAEENPIWPYRVPSLLGGLLGVYATFGLGQRLVGRRAALLGAAMLAGSAVLVVETHIAKTDAALLAATTATMGLLGRAYLDPGGFARRHAAGFWIALAVGILVKGPITPMVAGLAAGSLAFADRRERGSAWLLALRPGWGVPLMLAIVLPWFVAIGVATHGAFFAQSVGGDLGRKLASDDESHAGPPGLHLLLLPLTLFPAAIAVLACLPAAWRARSEPAVRFLIAWVLPSWLVFEAAPTKLPHYPLPLFPPLCLFAARWALEARRFGPPAWLRRVAIGACGLAAALFGLGAAALPVVIGPRRAGVDLLGVPALAGATLLGWLIWRALRDWPRAILSGLLAMPLLTWSVLGLELPRLGSLWIAPQLAAALRAHWRDGQPPDAGFATLGFAEPSVRFLCGTDTGLFGDATRGAEFLAAAPDRVLAVEQRDLPAFAQASARIGIVPHGFATVAGFNYSHGRRVALTLFESAPNTLR